MVAFSITDHGQGRKMNTLSMASGNMIIGFCYCCILNASAFAAVAAAAAAAADFTAAASNKTRTQPNQQCHMQQLFKQHSYVFVISLSIWRSIQIIIEKLFWEW